MFQKGLRMEKLLQQETTYRQLTLRDRCDRCGEVSQAFVRAVKVIDNNETELLFCGHHFRKHEPVLIAQGWLIQDDRDKIDQKAMVTVDD
jgi:hypothetical protein